VVSLDVIEHIPAELEDAYFWTMLANLSDDGMCIIGTPNEHASAYASPQSRAGHVNLYTAERLTAAVGRYFQNTFVFGMNDEVVHTGFYPMSHYLFVVGAGKRDLIGS
jgi:2-polyprenyl-3-methyl-5-hydroxy-6-metoxy-1,4-benzoquinol methylase